MLRGSCVSADDVKNLVMGDSILNNLLALCVELARYKEHVHCFRTNTVVPSQVLRDVFDNCHSMRLTDRTIKVLHVSNKGP